MYRSTRWNFVICLVLHQKMYLLLVYNLFINVSSCFSANGGLVSYRLLSLTLFFIFYTTVVQYSLLFNFALSRHVRFTCFFPHISFPYKLFPLRSFCCLFPFLPLKCILKCKVIQPSCSHFALDLKTNIVKIEYIVCEILNTCDINKTCYCSRP